MGDLISSVDWRLWSYLRLERWLAWVTGIGPSAAVLTLAVAVGTLANSSDQFGRWDQTDTSIWLPVGVSGSLVLVDGSLPRQTPVAAIDIGEADDIETLQVEGGVVIDRIGETLSRVDNRTRTMAITRRLPRSAQIVGNEAGSVWMVDRYKIAPIDTFELLPVGPAIETPFDRPQDLVVDRIGRLWLVSDGALYRVSRDGTIADFGTRWDTMVAVGEAVAALDTDRKQLRFLGNATTCDVEVTEHTYLKGGRHHVLVLSDQSGPRLIDAACNVRSMDEIGVGANIGATAEFGGYYHLVDDTTRRVWSIDTSTEEPGSVVATPPVSDHSSPVQLMAAGPILIYNQPTDAVAGVVESGRLVPFAGLRSSGTYECVTETRRAVVGQAVTFTALSTGDGVVAEDVQWFASPGSEALHAGGRIVVVADEPTSLSYSFHFEGRVVACPVVQVAVPAKPVTVAVEADGGGDYSTLHEAVENVPPDSTIELGAGAHTVVGDLVVNKALRISGVGAEATTVVGEGFDRSVVSATGVALAIESVTVDASAAGSTVNGVTVYDGAVELSEVVLVGATGDGLLVAGRSSAVVSESRFVNNLAAGVRGVGSSELNVSDSFASGNGLNGFEFRDSASVTVSGNTSTMNGTAGFAWSDASTGIARNNVSDGNANDGFAMRGVAEPELAGNRSTSNGFSGFAWYDDTSNAATDNEASGNSSHGFYVLDRASPLLSGNRAIGNRGTGFIWWGESAGSATGNVASNNTSSGFAFFERTSPTVTGNQATGNGRYGYRVDVDSMPGWQGNQASGNADGPTLGIELS